MPTSPAIDVRGLHKQYGTRNAVDGIDLQVHEGEIFALLGPNGAGKTTTVEILEGYRKRSAGTVSVLGVDTQHGDRAWRNRIGLVLQSSKTRAPERPSSVTQTKCTRCCNWPSTLPARIWPRPVPW